tara:strand:+ start:241 stop:465 length:225 start_codon:yes stop_codon:yes gene_type:complete
MNRLKPKLNKIMMTTQIFDDKNYFIVLSTKKDGKVNRSAFIFADDARAFHDKLWHKREDEFKRIEILEVLQTTK